MTTGMILRSPNLCRLSYPRLSSFTPTCKGKTAAKYVTSRKASFFRSSQTLDDVEKSKGVKRADEAICSSRFCSCATRRHLLQAMATRCLFSAGPSSGFDPPPNDPKNVAALNKFHPPRPEWYEELYASVLQNCTKAYEEEVAGFKSQLFPSLKGKAEKVLEFGIGTGPNLKYYANEPGVQIFGIDPNKKMEKYARQAAYDAGVLPSNFTFMQAVGEVLPLSDSSVDAVVGTLVLCSVKDVNLALQEVKRVLRPGGIYLFVEHVAAEDGTIRRFMQGILDPLQQFVADGCHLTRKTGDIIAEAGFSAVDIQQSFVSTASIINPHVYGVARK